jgi:hypothetical protein
VTSASTVSKSSSKTSLTSTSSASVFSCGKLPSIPPRTYVLRATAGPKYVYTPANIGMEVGGQLYLPSEYPSVDAAIPACERVCSSFTDCVGFSIYNDTNAEIICNGWPEVYNASGLTIDTDSSSLYLEIYDSLNWNSPAGDLLPNGDFETGCLGPWHPAGGYGPGAEVNITGPIVSVVPCGRAIAFLEVTTQSSTISTRLTMLEPIAN